ncbi:hypothetical protein ABZS29_14810 [Kribbella sp. NPDC005582]|uniref:hypothetical protein n=1 Tax=Kribbella sp. NPDC005582 TaxID=3156893 RepID=UPI00339F0ABA
MSAADQTRRPWQLAGAGALAVGACAMCCAGPILAVLGGLSIASVVAALWIPALAVVAVMALLAVVWVHRKRRRTTCDAPTGPVDVGMPTRVDTF